jgi:hypothetical protein
VIEVSTNNFGILIAYLLPGFVTVWGISFFSKTVRGWLGASTLNAPTVGGFLYVTLGSIAAGLVISMVRWAILDGIHHETGIPEPKWKFSQLEDKLNAFEGLVEYHYRYYQFNSNMFLAVVFTYVAWLLSHQISFYQAGWMNLVFLFLEAVFWLGSRDTLRKYYQRTADVLGTTRKEQYHDKRLWH